MSVYAFIDEQGYVTHIMQFDRPPEGGILLEAVTPFYPPSPFEGAKLQIVAGNLEWKDTLSPEQRLKQEWAVVKNKRDQLLQESDWRVIKAVDIGVPLDESWKAYRQALRDITTQTDPFSITWPQPPNT